MHIHIHTRVHRYIYIHIYVCKYIYIYIYVYAFETHVYFWNMYFGRHTYTYNTWTGLQLSNTCQGVALSIDRCVFTRTWGTRPRGGRYRRGTTPKASPQDVSMNRRCCSLSPCVCALIRNAPPCGCILRNFKEPNFVLKASLPRPPTNLTCWIAILVRSSGTSQHAGFWGSLFEDTHLPHERSHCCRSNDKVSAPGNASELMKTHLFTSNQPSRHRC